MIASTYSIVEFVKGIKLQDLTTAGNVSFNKSN